MKTRIALSDLTMEWLGVLAESESVSEEKLAHRYIREFLAGNQADVSMLRQRGKVKLNDGRELWLSEVATAPFTPAEGGEGNFELLLGKHLTENLQLPYVLSYLRASATPEQLKAYEWDSWGTWAPVFLSARVAIEKAKLDGKEADAEERALFPEEKKK